jgi:hypothetical protein
LASQLTGLLKTLAWTDYGTPRPGPRPTGPATAALTHAGFTRNHATFTPAAGSRPTAFLLDDNLSVAITFGAPPRSFVMAWVFSTMSSADQAFLLAHEQGHYNINALIVRDFFVDVMLLKQQTFATRQEGINRVTQIKAASLDKIQAAQNLYDREVHAEQARGVMNGPMQQAWSGFIQAAFTQARVPASAAPNGTRHKARLLDLVRASGRSI